MRPGAVFLDKDGTLVENLPYNADPAKMRLSPGAAEGIRLIHQAGLRLFVVSNQSGVARGHFPEEALAGVEARLRELMADAGARLAGFYYCPHHAEGRVAKYSVACDCRKPGPGMVLNAARDHAIDLSKSWLVGDILDDVEAGRRAGCRTILVDNGHETEWKTGDDRTPDHTAPDLAEAARIILSASEPAAAAAGDGSGTRSRR
ncbi:MAG: HAD family hydrolase [Actinomycetota bacterium]|nr:HAD family hydrolase [Actinomycetota bacterium]